MSGRRAGRRAPAGRVAPRLAYRREAFTLVELLVVIGVIAILIAITLPALRGARTAAMSVGCQNNLRSIFAASASYLNDHERILPFAEVIIWYPIGDEAPLPAIGSYIDAPLPRMENGVVVTAQPWLCAEDQEWGPASGTSYDYFPALIMGILGQRETSRLLEQQPRTPLWTDHLPYHRDWRNYIRYDGVLAKREVGEGY